MNPPPTVIPRHVEGTSFVPLMRNPQQPGKPFAVGRFKTGDTIRTDRFRFSEYRAGGGAGRVTGQMLYDHRNDPGENTNVADDPSNASTVSALANDLNRVKGR